MYIHTFKFNYYSKIQKTQSNFVNTVTKGTKKLTVLRMKKHSYELKNIYVTSVNEMTKKRKNIEIS